MISNYSREIVCTTAFWMWLRKQIMNKGGWKKNFETGQWPKKSNEVSTRMRRRRGKQGMSSAANIHKRREHIDHIQKQEGESNPCKHNDPELELMHQEKWWAMISTTRFCQQLEELAPVLRRQQFQSDWVTLLSHRPSCRNGVWELQPASLFRSMAKAT